MKKRITVIVMMIAVVFSLFAMQETFNFSSPEYQQTMSLLRAAGLEKQMLVAPVSTDQLLFLLDTIDANSLDSSERAIYENLKDSLMHPYMVYGKDDWGFDANITSCPDVFFHTANEDVPANESVEQKRDIYPFFEVGGKVYFSDYFYGHFYFQDVEGTTDRSKHLSLNYAKTVYEMDMTSPYKALVSAGKGGFNFSIGRDRLALGHGNTGNLLLGDNFWFEDFAKASFINGFFSYDMTMITFDNNKTYGETTYNPLVCEEFDFNGKHQLVVIHQFSLRPFKWFNLSASEGMLQYGDNLFGDLSILSPIMLLHNVNSYRTGSANNFFSLDFSFTPVKSLELDATLYFDQIQQPQELDDGKPTSTTAPNAFGFMVNAVYSRAILGGMADFYVEGVYTNPAVYLKEQESDYDFWKDDTVDFNYWNVDLIVGNEISDTSMSDIGYLGYKYGPDTIAIGTGFNYSIIGKLQLSFETLFKIHGSKGIRFYDGQQDYNDVGPDYYKLKTPTGNPEYRLNFISSAEYKPNDWLTLKAAAGLINAWNYHNEGRTFHDFQLSLGVKINPVHIGKNILAKSDY